MGEHGKALAGGTLQGQSGGALTVDGTLFGQHGLALASARGASIDGQLQSGDALSLQADDGIRTGKTAQLQSSGNMTLRTGQDANLAGAALSDGAMSVDAARDVRLDGSAFAYGGELSVKSGNDLLLGAASQTQGQGVTLDAARDLATAGDMVAAGPAVLTAGRDAAFGSIRCRSARNALMPMPACAVGCAWRNKVAYPCRNNMRWSVPAPISSNAPMARSTRPDSISRGRSGPCTRTESMRTCGATCTQTSISRGMKWISPTSVMATRKRRPLVAASNTS